MKKLNKNQGITLIALVITIIVMLILVGVSISMAVNGGLFNYAGKAVGETKKELNAESEIANGGVKVDNQTFNSLNEYVEEAKKEKIEFKLYERRMSSPGNYREIYKKAYEVTKRNNMGRFC